MPTWQAVSRWGVHVQFGEKPAPCPQAPVGQTPGPTQIGPAGPAANLRQGGGHTCPARGARTVASGLPGAVSTARLFPQDQYTPMWGVSGVRRGQGCQPLEMMTANWRCWRSERPIPMRLGDEACGGPFAPEWAGVPPGASASPVGGAARRDCGSGCGGVSHHAIARAPGLSARLLCCSLPLGVGGQHDAGHDQRPARHYR